MRGRKTEIIPAAVRDLIALDLQVAACRIDSYGPLTLARDKEVWRTFASFCAPKDA